MHDKDIIGLYFQRSEKAVAETRVKYGRDIMRLAVRILADRSDAEECENDTYMCTWKAIPPHKPVNFRAFLLKIARNNAVNRYRYIKAEKRNPSAAVSFEELAECICTGDDIAEQIDAAALAESINEFLSELDAESRRVFMLRYWHFYPIGDICRLCAVSKSKAESMLFRTRNKLRKHLTERGYDL